MIPQLAFSLLLSILAPLLWADCPTVITRQGPVQGSKEYTKDGTMIYQFLGIPFAQPPIGRLRFEVSFSDGSDFGEDCLYLNVWTSDLKGNLPVLIFIHGGGFLQGSAARHPGKPLMEVYARRGIVMVTIQYRLGPFGFLTKNDSRISPNLGLWDQNRALKWVNENIDRFGGDPKRVTIFGESAGSVSVSYQTISEHSKNLFSAAIEMSGSMLCGFAKGKNVVKFTEEYIKALGCGDARDYKECLQSKSEHEFLNVKAGWGDICGFSDLDYLGFAPIPDGDFLPLDVETAIETAPKVPTLMGVNQKEGRAFTLQGEFPYSMAPSFYKMANSKYLKAYIKDWITSGGYLEHEKDAAGEDIYKFLSMDNDNDTDHFFWIEQYVLSYSDFMMNIPIVREAVARTKSGSPVWAFTFDHSNPAQWPKDQPVQGSTHAGEYPWTLEMHLNFNYTAEDLVVKDAIQDLFVQFVKTRDPNIDRLKWDPFTIENFDYMSISPKSEMKKDWFGSNYRFWTNTMNKYSYDFISEQKWKS
ncbi:unnamed protein product, partial [Mesorhabditis spiculigera]